MHPNVPNAERDILPANIKPIHYDLRLAPDLNNYSFTRTVSIKLAVQDKKCPVIKLNAKDLDISEAKFESFPATSIQHNAEAEETAFTFPEAALVREEGTLHLTFSGPITDKMAGFYRSSYDNPVTGKKEFLAVTNSSPLMHAEPFPAGMNPTSRLRFPLNWKLILHTLPSQICIQSTPPLMQRMGKRRFNLQLHP